MKATEYIEKYKRLAEPECDNAESAKLLTALFLEMLDEIKELIKVRHIQSDSAYLALLKEFNVKGNKIGKSLGLKPNWFDMTLKITKYIISILTKYFNLI